MDTLKKLSMATRKVLLLTSVGTVLTASPGWAVPIRPISLDVSSPVTRSCSSRVTTNCTNNGTQNGTSASTAYIDDILLNSITFGSSTTFQRTTNQTTNQIRTIQDARVFTGRGNINAEYGDQDDSRDGNPNPFVSAGIVSSGNPSDAQRESTNPTATQDNAIRASFSTLSLSQGIDGEELPFSYDLVFQNGILDDNSAVDQVPELIFFERGVNSDFSVQAITGGTVSNPTFSPNTVEVLRGNLWPTGVYIDTVEIGDGQQLGAVGLDLNDFGVGANPVYGIRVTALNDSGPDMYGQFITAREARQFTGVPSAVVPFEFSPGLGILVLGAWGAIAQLNSKVQKWKTSRGDGGIG